MDGLEALIRRGLIREVLVAGDSDVHYDFTHGRLRDVAYEDTSLARRRLLHGRVADALTRTGTGEPDATRWARIAAHATLAGRGDEAASAHLRAGEGAREVYANPEAREHFEAALALGTSRRGDDPRGARRPAHVDGRLRRGARPLRDRRGPG